MFQANRIMKIVIDIVAAATVLIIGAVLAGIIFLYLLYMFS